MARHTPDIAIIGAGAAGLACADRLAEHGLQVQVFDLGRRPGGRIALRHRAGLDFEHGAVGYQDLVERLLRRVPLTPRCRITDLRRTAEGTWRLFMNDGPLRSQYSEVVLALPPEPCATLLAEAPHLANQVRQSAMAPVLTALVAVPTPLGRSVDHIEFRDASLAAAHRQRYTAEHDPPRAEGWVLQATREFSLDNQGCDPDAVAMHLWQRFLRNLHLSAPSPVYLRGHRWRHGHTRQPLGRACLHDSLLGLGVCGDWCLGDTVDHALASGRALAARMIGLPELAPRRSLAAKEGTS